MSPRIPRIVSLVWLLLIVAGGCRTSLQIQPGEHVVPHPISGQANHVLSNLVTQCGSATGHWAHEMGPGCTTIWATQLGLRAGKRRERDDLIRLGRLTAKAQSTEITKLIWRSLIGTIRNKEPSAYGFPALMVSAAVDRKYNHERQFFLILDRALEERDHLALKANEAAGLAVLLAEVYRANPGEQKHRLGKARELAAGISPNMKELRAFALAAVARASRNPADIKQARDAVEAAVPEIGPDLRPRFPPDRPQVLSYQLATVTALCEMAAVSAEDKDATRARLLLDHVFSKALFDGEFIMHDCRSDRRSLDFCSGCNFHALYLVDRLYGDTWKIDPLPALPERRPPRFVKETSTHPLGPLYPDQQGVYSFQHFGVRIRYLEIPAEKAPPRGALEIRYRFNDAHGGCTFEQGQVIPLGADDRAECDLTRGPPTKGTHDPEKSKYVLRFSARQDRTRQMTITSVLRHER